MNGFHWRGWDADAPSSGEVVAEHRETASRLLAGGLVLNHVPVLRKHPVLHAHDVADDLCRRQAETAETSMEDDEITGGSGNVGYKRAILGAQTGRV